MLFSKKVAPCGFADLPIFGWRLSMSLLDRLSVRLADSDQQHHLRLAKSGVHFEERHAGHVTIELRKQQTLFVER